MIKRYENITLRDYNRVERTGKLGHLKSWYNILPVSFFAKKIRKELVILIDKVNNSEDNSDISFLEWKYQSITKINAIRANYLGIINILQIQTQLNGFKTYLSRYSKKKLKIKRSPNAQCYINRLKEYTGISIESNSDIKSVGDLLELKIDRYNQMVINNNLENVSDGKKVYLSVIASKICGILNIPFDWNYTVLQIIDFKNDANEELRKQNKQEDVRDQ